jgi:hypothetical protein
MRVEALWTITRAAIAAGLTAVMLFHWQVTEANATVTVAPVHGEILFAEPVPSGRWESVGTYRITHYCPCKRCNGRNAGKTASGAAMTPGRTVAAKGYQFGTKLRINGQTYTVEDRGVPARCVDILVETHEEALRRGMYYTEVFVWREGAE